MLTSVNADDAVSRGSIDEGGGIKKRGFFSSTFYR